MIRQATIAMMFAAGALLAAPDAGNAQGRGMGTGSGQVAAACRYEIAKYCDGMSHGKGAVRACLNGKRWKLSRRCKRALDNTGGGRGWR